METLAPLAPAVPSAPAQATRPQLGTPGIPGVPPPLDTPTDTRPTSFSLKTFLDDRQELCFERIYQKAGIASGHYSVDRVIERLTELAPYNPRPTTRALLKADIETTTATFDSTTVQKLIHEAAEKISVLKKFQAFADSRTSAQTQELDTRIARLREELGQLEREKEVALTESDAVTIGTHRRLDELVGVISFLDEWQEALRQETLAPQEPEHAQPTFLDDATILRLLKAS